MSEEEQDRLYGDLLVKEKKAKKNLACLQSRARQTHESLTVVLEALRDCEIDFDYVRETYAKVSGTDIGKLISEMEATCNTVAHLQADIRKIEHPDSF